MAGETLVPVILLDECMPASIGDFFETKGYIVHRVAERLAAGTPDKAVVAAALDLNAIVVTVDSDFRNLQESNEGQKGRLTRADRIFFKRCSHVQVHARIVELFEVIDAEYRLAKSRDAKFFMQITRDTYTVVR